MKALLRKDFYVLWRQMRIFVLLILVMSVVPMAFSNVFVVIWCSMLPYTAMAYDERSHWGELAAMMPYSRRDLVLSKYVLGWLSMSVAAVLLAVIQAVSAPFTHVGPSLSSLAISFFAGMIALAFTLPMVLRFGVERGRLGFMIVLFGVALVGGAASGMMGEEMVRLPVPALVLLPVAAAVLTAVSIPLSMKLYKVS